MRYITLLSIVGFLGACAPSDQSLECTVNYLDGNVVEDTEAHLGSPTANVDFAYREIDAMNFSVPDRIYAGTLDVLVNRSEAFEWTMRFLYVKFAFDADNDGNYGEPELDTESPTNFSTFPITCDFYNEYGEAVTLESFSPDARHGEGRAQFAHDPEADFPAPEDGETIEGVPVPHRTTLILGCTIPGASGKRVSAYLPKADSSTWGMVEYYNRPIVPVVFTNNGTVLNGTPPVLNPSPMN